MYRRQALKSMGAAAVAVTLAGCLGGEDSTSFSEYGDEELLPPEAEVGSVLSGWEVVQVEDSLRAAMYRIEPHDDENDNSISLECESHEDQSAAAEDYRSSEHYGDVTEHLDIGDEGFYKVDWDGHTGAGIVEFYEGAARASIRRNYPPEPEIFDPLYEDEKRPEYFDTLVDVTRNHWGSL